MQTPMQKYTKRHRHKSLMIDSTSTSYNSDTPGDFVKTRKESVELDNVFQVSDVAAGKPSESRKEINDSQQQVCRPQQMLSPRISLEQRSQLPMGRGCSGYLAYILTLALVFPSMEAHEDVKFHPGGGTKRENFVLGLAQNATTNLVNISKVDAPMDVQSEVSFLMNRYLSDSTGSLDVLRVEASWLRVMKDKLVDLNTVFESNVTEAFDPDAIKALTVDGKLLGLPSRVDSLRVYYRKDLLNNNGLSVPSTWEELETSARTIQMAERQSGAPNFWGLTFPAQNDETLTWVIKSIIASYGGGHFIEPDGSVSIKNSRAASCYRRMKEWINTITPPALLSKSLEDSRKYFLDENAAFHLDLGDFTGDIQGLGGANSLGNRTGVGYIPFSTQSLSSSNTSIPYYWGWAIVKGSESRLGVKTIVSALTFEEAQVAKSQELADYPTLSSLSGNLTRVCGEFSTSAPNVCSLSPQSSQFGTARALEVMGERYFDVSEVIRSSSHTFLVGETEDADYLVSDIEEKLARILKTEDEEVEGGAVAISLFCVDMSLVIALAAWTWCNRNEKTIRAAQPQFQLPFLAGIGISSFAVLAPAFEIFTSSQTILNNLCQLRLWAAFLGFTLSATAIQAKIVRVKVLMMDARSRKVAWAHSSNLFFRAMGYVMLVVAGMLAVQTVISPFEWQMSRGGCHSSNEAGIYIFEILLAFCFLSLIATLFLCFTVRRIPEEFSGHRYITALTLCWIHSLVAVAILYNMELCGELYLMTVFLFLKDITGVLCIFVPKVMARYEVYTTKQLQHEDILFHMRRDVRYIKSTEGSRKGSVWMDMDKSRGAKQIAISRIKLPKNRSMVMKSQISIPQSRQSQSRPHSRISAEKSPSRIKRFELKRQDLEPSSSSATDVPENGETDSCVENAAIEHKLRDSSPLPSKHRSVASSKKGVQGTGSIHSLSQEATPKPCPSPSKEVTPNSVENEPKIEGVGKWKTTQKSASEIKDSRNTSDEFSPVVQNTSRDAQGRPMVEYRSKVVQNPKNVELNLTPSPSPKTISKLFLRKKSPRSTNTSCGSRRGLFLQHKNSNGTLASDKSSQDRSAISRCQASRSFEGRALHIPQKKSSRRLLAEKKL